MLPRIVLSGAIITAALSSGVVAQEPASQPSSEPYQPQLGQKGKDVQWVPTPPALVEKMLDLAAVTPKDYVIDLGSGDGVLVIAAAKRGARAMGIEYDRNLVEYAKKKADEEQVSRRAKFVRGDIFKTDFSDATVLTSFLLPSMNLELRPRMLAMKPGTRIVSNTFTIGEWEPDETAAVEPCERWCKALLWIVPARVGGTWRTSTGELALTQKFQFVTGTLGGSSISDGRLRGETLTFTADGIAYTARVDDLRMRGTYTENGEQKEWSASFARRLAK